MLIMDPESPDRLPRSREGAYEENISPKQHASAVYEPSTQSGIESDLECGLLSPLLANSQEDDLPTGLSFDLTRFASCNQSTSKPTATEGPSANGFNVSEKPFCRICHEGDHGNRELIAPCHCMGSVTYLHRYCLEHWLQTANKTYCELCGYRFHIVMKAKPFKQWLCHSLRHRRGPHNLWVDLIIVAIISALVSVSAGLCLMGARHLLASKDTEGVVGCRAVLEGLGLTLLSTVLILVYLLWVMITIRYYFIVWQAWSRTNQVLTVQQPLERYQANITKPS